MNIFASPRARQAAIGALLGALIALALDVLGIQAALKLGLLIVPAILVGAVFGMTRLGSLLWAAAAVLVAAILVVAYTPLAASLVRPMVRADRIPASPLDAVLVLSAGITRDGLMQWVTSERLLKGAQLSRGGVGRLLIVSRERVRSSSGQSVSDSADQMATINLVGVRVPLFFADSAASTRDEALRMKRIAASQGVVRVAVVTSPLHSRRACATFEAVGFIVTCVPSEAREFPLHDLSDPGDRLRAFETWVYETAGTLKYRSAGWIR